MVLCHLHFLFVILLSHPVFFLNPIFSSFLYLSNVTACYIFFFFLSFFTLHSSLAPYFSAQRAYFFHGIYWRWHQASDCGWGGWTDHSLEGKCKRERERERESRDWERIGGKRERERRKEGGMIIVWKVTVTERERERKWGKMRGRSKGERGREGRMEVKVKVKVKVRERESWWQSAFRRKYSFISQIRYFLFLYFYFLFF